MEVIVGARYVKGGAAAVPAGNTSRTSAGPAVFGGVTTVIVVPAGLTVKPVPGTPSKVTPVAPVRPVPVMVTVVPPEVGPLVGVSPVALAALPSARYV